MNDDLAGLLLIFTNKVMALLRSSSIPHFLSINIHAGLVVNTLKENCNKHKDL